VHEAFAEQISPDPETGVTAPEPPPDSVNELPPEVKPEGDEVVWIPGYWFWDDEREDYIWVSGIWRRPPPGRRWVPGYWQETDTGYQWVSGFWSSDAAADIDYLEDPPESLEAGPSSPAPSEDHFWTPGIWFWAEDEYRWQCGSWRRYREDWVWVAARYIWTPRGCVYVPGYWDYSLTRRGHLFPPIYYAAPVYRRVDYVYRPTCWISYQPLLLHLFVRPGFHHLYFGDYYSPRYRRFHYTPCYSYHARYPGYASLYVYYQYHYRRRGIDYCDRVRGWHGYYARHPALRPATTYRLQVRRGGGLLDGVTRHHHELARPYGLETAGRGAAGSLVALSRTSGDRHRRRSHEFRELIRQRQQFETARDTLRGRERGKALSRSAPRGRLTLPSVPSERRLATAIDGQAMRIPTDIVQANRGVQASRENPGQSHAPVRKEVGKEVAQEIERRRGTEPRRESPSGVEQRFFSGLLERQAEAAQRAKPKEVRVPGERHSGTGALQQLLEHRRARSPSHERSPDRKGTAAPKPSSPFRLPKAFESSRPSNPARSPRPGVPTAGKQLRPAGSRGESAGPRRDAAAFQPRLEQRSLKPFSDVSRRGRMPTESKASGPKSGWTARFQRPTAKAAGPQLRSRSFRSAGGARGRGKTPPGRTE